jgi:hypothetical protein
MVSKACLVGAYQTKLEAIAAHEGVELAVVVPPVWQDPAGEVVLERSHTCGYHLFVDPIRLNGQFHLHYYPLLKERLRTFRPDILHMDEEPYNVATWLAVRQARAVAAQSLFFSWQNIERHYPFPFSWIEKKVLASVDHAIMGNAAAADVWRSKGYRGPYSIIPQFGVDPALFHPPPQRDRGRGGTTAWHLAPAHCGRGTRTWPAAKAGPAAGHCRPGEFRWGHSLEPDAGLPAPSRRTRSTLAYAPELERTVWAGAGGGDGLRGCRHRFG